MACSDKASDDKAFRTSRQPASHSLSWCLVTNELVTKRPVRASTRKNHHRPIKSVSTRWLVGCAAQSLFCLPESCTGTVHRDLPRPKPGTERLPSSFGCRPAPVHCSSTALDLPPRTIAATICLQTRNTIDNHTPRVERHVECRRSCNSRHTCMLPTQYYDGRSTPDKRRRNCHVVSLICMIG